MILRQYNLNKHFLSPTCKRRCTIDHKPGSDPGLRHMGRQARATTEACFDSKFLVPFTSMCLMVLLLYVVIHTVEHFCSL